MYVDPSHWKSAPKACLEQGYRLYEIQPAGCLPTGTLHVFRSQVEIKPNESVYSQNI